MQKLHHLFQSRMRNIEGTYREQEFVVSENKKLNQPKVEKNEKKTHRKGTFVNLYIL